MNTKATLKRRISRNELAQLTEAIETTFSVPADIREKQEQLSRAVAGITSEPEPLNFDYSRLPKADAKELKEDALEIKSLNKQNIINVLSIGRILLRNQERLGRGVFGEWIASEFPEISRDTITNIMNTSRTAEGYSIETLQKLNLNSLYLLFRSTTPEAARTEAFQLAESGTPPDRRETRQIIKNYRLLQLRQSGVNEAAQSLLVGTTIAENPTSLQQLARLGPQKQIEVARILSRTPELTVRKALSSLKNSADEGQEVIPFESKVVSSHQITNTQYGNWENLIDGLEDESINLIVVEAPLGKDWLPNYRLLTELLYPKLVDGAVCLCSAGHYNLQFIGPLLEPLKVAWTLDVRRRPGNSRRVVGLNFASSFVPYSVSYKNVWNKSDVLVDDVRQEDLIHEDDDDFDPAEAMKLNLGDAPAPSIESALSYYIQCFLRSTETFVHLVINSANSFHIEEALKQAALQKDAAQVLTLIGR